MLFAEKPKSRTTTTTSTVLDPRTDEVDEDAPAGIGGAEFFGGNKEKQEFYDPVAEAEAAVELRSTSVVLEFDRFADRSAFADETTAAIARDVQLQLNQAATAEIVETTSSSTTSLEDVTYKYADNLQWETDLQVKSSTPVLELVQARDFYRQVHVAVTAGGPKSDSTVELRWELSLEWPTVWEPRVLLTGTSRLTVDSETKIITQQIDTLDDPDLIPVIQKQILPRFWDLYHIGMTPSAELSPRLKSEATSTSKVGLLASYQLYDLPPRWVMQPSLLDTGSREDNNALVLPNHAFSCVIKTMGPTKQRFTPVSGVQVQLVSQQQMQQANGGAAGAAGGGGLKLQWSIPLAVEYGSQAVWMLPGGEDATEEEEEENGVSSSSPPPPPPACSNRMPLRLSGPPPRGDDRVRRESPGCGHCRGAAETLRTSCDAGRSLTQGRRERQARLFLYTERRQGLLHGGRLGNGRLRVAAAIHPTKRSGN